MDQSDRPSHGVKAQGIGASVPRKEDARHLAGEGFFVGDMAMPGLQEVAFLRSPLAHATISATRIPDDIADVVVLRPMMDCRDIVADSTLPSYQVSPQPPLADDPRAVRRRARCAWHSHQPAHRPKTWSNASRFDYDELPVHANVTSALAATSDFMHEGWTSNRFVTLKADRDFDTLAATADVVVSRRIDLARQCMVPLEGKAVLAYWDHRADQLVVYTSTQVPHMIRSGLAQFLQTGRRPGAGGFAGCWRGVWL